MSSALRGQKLYDCKLSREEKPVCRLLRVKSICTVNRQIENGFLIVVELFLPWCSFISLKILWLRTTFSVLLLSILANCLSSTNVCLPYEDVIFSCSQQPCEINWFNFRSRLILLLVNEGLNVISYSVSLIPVKCNHS